jgi:predicted RNA-binding Zn ribbon-like protein
VIGPRSQDGQSVTRKLRFLRFDAGALSLNLVATVGRRRSTPVERLDTPGRLAEWFLRSGLPVAPGAIDQGLLERVRELREAMYEVLRAVIAASPPPQDAIAKVNSCATAQVPAPQMITAGSAVQVVWAPDGAAGAGISGESAVAVVARDLIRHQGEGQWPSMLRTCAADDCGMIFLDSSQGGRRRWCSMEYCGNRAKAAAHRARHGGGQAP